jgi:DNA/RNA-binding domain of Phe-tRNA-synthetase-like protein
MQSITLDPAVAGVVRLGLIAASPVAIAPSGGALLSRIAAVFARLAAEHAGKEPGAIEGLAPARQLYRSCGVDPTRTRPSSEALLRRAVAGKPFPQVSNAVDLCNLCAVEFLLPIGLYDSGCINGPITLRRGAPGDAYPGIRKDDVHLEGRLALYDEAGPFGNPTSDSLRTCVTPQTGALLMVIFAPSGYPAARMAEHARGAASLMEQFLAPPGNAVATSSQVLP